MEAWLDARLGVLPRPGLWWAIRTYAPLVHAPAETPWSFGPRPSYLAARHQARTGDPELALRHLVRRFLAGFGPASVPDIAQFALVPRARARAAVEAMAGELVTRDGPTGTALLDVPDGVLPPEDVPAPPRLLPMWDSVLLAHADRTRLIPLEYRRVIARSNGDTLPAVLVDGEVAGVWRPVDGGIEVTALRRLPDPAWAEIEDEARGLLALIAARDPAAYRRYGRWWDALPVVERRTVSG
jgi:hypothetical protein